MRSALFLVLLQTSLAATTVDETIQNLINQLDETEGPQRVEILNNLASAFETQSADEMERYATRALDLATEIDDQAGKARALNNLALVHRNTGRQDQAEECAKDALSIYTARNEPEGRAVTLNIIGSIFDERSENLTAIKYYEESLDIFKEIENERGISGTLHNIGSAYAELGQFDRAIFYLKNAISIKRKLGLMDSVATGLTGVAIVHINQGDYVESKKLIDEAIMIQDDIGDLKNKAYSLNVLGVICSMTGDNDAAIRYYLKAHEIHVNVGNEYGISLALNNIAICHERSGHYETALKYYQKALKMDEKNHNKPGLVRAFNNIGKIHKNLSRFEKAIDYFQKSRDLADQIGDRHSVGLALNNLGSVYESRGDLARARDLFNQSLDESREIGASAATINAWVNLANVAEQMGEVDDGLAKAGKACDQARAIGDREGLVAGLTVLGRLQLKAGDGVAARRSLDEGLRVAEEIDVPSLTRDIHLALSDTHAELGDFAGALEHHRRFTKIQDQIVNETAHSRIAELEARYESEKRDNQIALLTKDNEIQKLRVSRERFRKNAWIAGFSLVLVLAIILLRYYLHFFAFWKKKQFIGQYKIVDQIGSGGMGVIYEARRLLSGAESVAVKVIRDEISNDESLRKRFLNEALIIDRLDHPHIVKVLERGQHDTRLYMAMELLQGRLLTEVIASETRLPLRESTHIMNQLVDTVAAIHDKGIVHRDLKPDNVMLITCAGDPWFVKLLDFGLARTETLTRLTETGEILGTVNYLPPERITRQEVSPAGDIYALGVIFYEMISGEKPFAGEAPVDIIRAILEVEPLHVSRFRPELPSRLATVIMSMMDREPENRPQGPELVSVFDALAKSHSGDPS